MPDSGRKTTNEQLTTCIHLTNSVSSLCYEHLSTTLRIPAGFQSLVDDLGGVLGVLGAVNLREVGAAQFGLAIRECIREMMWLGEKLRERKGRRWGCNEVTEYRRRIGGSRVLWETAMAGMDQLLVSPGVIDAHIAERLCEKRPLPTGLNYEFEVLARGKCEKVLNWLYPEDFDKRHLEIRSRRNDSIGKWFFEAYEVQRWINYSGVSLLWGRSVAGAGKTFLSSLIIDKVKDHAPQGSIGVAYIYFNYKDQAQQKTTQVFTSLIKQFCNQLPKLPIEVADLYDKLNSDKRRPTIMQLFTLLLTVVESFDQAYVILDALDECDAVLQRKELIPLIRRMTQSGSFKLFISSRVEISLGHQDIFDASHGGLKITILARDEDINLYIEEKINENPRFRNLLGKGRYKELIVSALKTYSQKLFLLVDLHIGYLCQQPTLRKVFIELENLKAYTSSRNAILAQTYSMILTSIQSQPQSRVKLAIETLSWLVKAQRTLTIQELKQAISVKPGDREIDESDMPDKETLVAACAGLVVVEGGTVRLSHQSVQEYLATNAIVTRNADENIAMSCITFLSFNEFSRGACGGEMSLEVRRQLYPFMDYAAKNMGFHLQSCDEDLTTDALFKLFMHPGSLSSYLQALKAQKLCSRNLGHHTRYIKRTPLHVAAALGHCSLVKLLLENGVGDLDIQAIDSNIGDKSAIHCATNAGHASIVKVLLQKGINVSDTIDGEKALLTAASGGWSGTVKLLLEEGADISDVGYDGDTALHKAALGGHEQVVQLLLDKGLSPSVKARDGMTALHRAASSGHSSVVELLLARGANILSTGESRETAIHQAAAGGHEDVVEMLLKGGANISATKTYGETALHSAASGGHEQVVRLLLRNGADVGASAVKNGGETALHQAASEGYRSVVKLLLEYGADVGVQTRYGVSVLQRAAYGGHTSVVRFLLDNGADVSVTTKYGVTALHRAASAGHESTVQLLLERGAVLSAFDADGDTALHGAAAAGHYHVVKLLIENGAKVDEVTKNSGETALHKAAFGGYRIIVDFLLLNGANRLALSKNGTIPLHKAASSGHGSVARTLLKDLADYQVSAAKHDGETPLHCAALGGYEAMVTLLLESGAEVSKKNGGGETALHIAAYVGNAAIALMLITRGAKVSDRNHRLETATDRARAGGQSQVATLLSKSELLEKRPVNPRVSALFAAHRSEYSR